MAKLLNGTGYTMHQGPDGFWLDIETPEIDNALRHSFQVYDIQKEVGDVLKFSINDGAIHGLLTNKTVGGSIVQVLPWTVNDKSSRVSIGTGITEIPAATGAPQAGFLDNRNVGMRYSVTLSGDSVLYVKVERTGDYEDNEYAWKASLVFGNISDAETETTASPIALTWKKELSYGTTSEHNAQFPDSTLPSTYESMFDGTITLTVNSHGYRYNAYYAYEGIAHIPIAYWDGDDNTFRQKTRSDIYWPYSPDPILRYVDTGVEGATIQSNNTFLP
jgi:hypothetical protein